ncbi:hypothetical protein BH11BAC2_BH11BAC2_02560 [soil metagenome]
MKVKILSLIVLLLWIFQSSFSWLYFEFEKSRCLESFHHQLSHSTQKEFTTLKFASQELVNWTEPKEEFEWHGIMYDVISVTHSAEGIEIKCVQDTRDTRITLAFVKKNK